MLNAVNTIFLLTSFAVCFGAVDIKQYLKVCDRNSVDVNDCMVEAVQDGLSAMAGGIDDMGVPPVDPFHQKELKVEYNRNQIGAKMVMKDIYVEGLKGATVHDARVRADDDSFYLEIDLSAPKIFVHGYYVGEGQYNALKIDASGSFNVTMTDLVWTWKIEGKPEKRDGDTYVKITSLYMRPDVGNMLTFLSNTNPDTKELIELGNRFVNENWRVLYKELLPIAQSNWNKMGVRIANKIFLKVPYDQIFPTS